MPWCIYPGVNDFDIKYFYDYNTIYDQKIFIYIILFCLPESSKITSLKYIYHGDNWVQTQGKEQK